jgi:hypothetical protein
MCRACRLAPPLPLTSGQRWGCHARNKQIDDDADDANTAIFPNGRIHARGGGSELPGACHLAGHEVNN